MGILVVVVSCEFDTIEMLLFETFEFEIFSGALSEIIFEELDGVTNNCIDSLDLCVLPSVKMFAWGGTGLLLAVTLVSLLDWSWFPA